MKKENFKGNFYQKAIKVVAWLNLSENEKLFNEKKTDELMSKWKTEGHKETAVFNSVLGNDDELLEKWLENPNLKRMLDNESYEQLFIEWLMNVSDDLEPLKRLLKDAKLHF